jgi:hypothetical protein
MKFEIVMWTLEAAAVLEAADDDPDALAGAAAPPPAVARRTAPPSTKRTAAERTPPRIRRFLATDVDPMTHSAPAITHTPMMAISNANAS